MQRDAIVQSLLDYHGSKVKTAESLGMSRATIGALIKSTIPATSVRRINIEARFDL